MNLAAQSGVLESMKFPIYSIKNNIRTYANIIEALKKSKCKLFMNASTSGNLWRNTKISNENSVTSPVSIYGLTKNLMKIFQNFSKV